MGDPLVRRRIVGFVLGAVIAGTLMSTCGAYARADEPKRIKAVLWVGGFAHDFEGFAKAMMADFEKRPDLSIRVVRDGSFLDAPDVNELDLIVMNHCYSNGDLRKVLPGEQKAKLLAAIQRGVGVVSLHGSYYSFPEWKEFRDVFGAKFVGHGRNGPIVMTAADEDHPITRGLPKRIDLISELYTSTALSKDCRVLMTAAERGQDASHPSVWTLTHAKGRVAVILPAHDVSAYRDEGFRTLIANACRWAACSESEETCK